MEQVFEWLHKPRNPRLFLYGQGGSGKTTLAYEVARYVAEDNIVFDLEKEQGFNIVIFVTAKAVELNVYDNSSQNFSGQDFDSSLSLYRAILVSSSWYTENDIEELLEDKLIELVENLFEELSIFLVIDDIDTLTTKGEDGGLENLLEICARSKKRSKILYTLRNAPTQALKHSVKVLGLTTSQEISEFLGLCCKQFKVSMPAPDDSGRLIAATEGRPLLIESVVALRRSCESYGAALKLFEDRAGTNARDYVFRREWDALTNNRRSRLLLAALSVLKERATSEEIGQILSADEEQVRESIGETLEMFLEVQEYKGVTTYSLGRMTQTFVARESRSLDLYEQIKQRVATFRRNFHPSLPALNSLRAQVERELSRAARSDEREAFSRVWSLVDNTDLEPRISEHPGFMELRGEVALRMVPLKLNEARVSITDAVRANHRVRSDLVGRLHSAEIASGSGVDRASALYAMVMEGKQFTPDDCVYVALTHASEIYTLAKNIRNEVPERAVLLLRESSSVHLENLARARDLNHSKLERIRQYARNTAFLLMLDLLRTRDEVALAVTLNEWSLLEYTVYDPLIQPFKEYLGQCASIGRTKEGVGRIGAAASRLERAMLKSNRWIDRNLMDEAQILMAEFRSQLNKAVSS